MLSIIRVKILALILGPIGLGILSQFYNINGLLFAIIPIGTMGLLKYFSEYIIENKHEQISYLIRIFFILNLPIVFIMILVLIIFPDLISKYLFSNTYYANYIVLYSFAIPTGLLFSFLDTYFKSIRKTKYYVYYSIITSIVSFITFITLLLIYQYEGAIISISISSLLSLIIGSIFIRKLNLFPRLKIYKKVDKSILKGIVGLGLVMMILTAIQQFSFLFIRSNIAVNLSLYDVGLFQSVYSLSNNLFSFFIGVLGIYSIPLISTHKTTVETVHEINRTLKLLLFIYTPLVTISFTLRHILILTFYSSAFINSGGALFYQLLGDYLKSISWVLGLWLIPYFKLKYLFIFEIINNLILMLVFYYLLVYKSFGIYAASIGYFCAFVGHLILNYIYLKKSLDFKFLFNNLFILITSLLFVLSIFIISNYSINYGYYIFIPLFIVWIYLCVSKNDVIQIKALVTQFIRK